MSEKRVVVQTLTNLARGVRLNKLIFLWLFPIINIKSFVVEIWKFGSESLKTVQTIRARYANSNTMEPSTQDSFNYRIRERDLEYPVELVQEEPGTLNRQEEEEYGAELTAKKILLGQEILCAQMSQDAINYPAGHSLALLGTDKFSDKVNSDPINVIKTAKSKVRKETGEKANLMVLGEQAFETLTEHPAIIAKLDNEKRAMANETDLEEIFQIEKVVVGESVYVDNSGQTVDIWGDNIIVTYVKMDDSVPKEERDPWKGFPEPEKKDQSFSYTFWHKKYPQIDKYYPNPGKLMAVRNTFILDSFIVGPTAGFLIQGITV